MVMNIKILSLVMIVLAIIIHMLNDFRPMDTYFPYPIDKSKHERYFTMSYYDARALFRSNVNKISSAKLHILPLDHIPHLDLSVDIAILPGSNSNILLHVSGTHGVEGFAGSAIQSALLNEYLLKNDSMQRPTIILVHALNPYGFAQLRRYNENNVDLNRNSLSKDQFQTKVNSDPNVYGYVDLYEIFNPLDVSNGNPYNWYWLRAIYALITKGFKASKVAVVNGNYHFPQSIFYGGKEKEPSLRLLEDFLQKHTNFYNANKVGIIDVHTGLGPPGYDTLMYRETCHSAVQKVFGNNEHISIIEGSSGDVAQGYDTISGLLQDGLMHTFRSHVDDKQENDIHITQEFGTVPGLFIMKALVEENAIYQYSRERRLKYGEKLRDVFYLHDSYSWKKQVIDRGIIVFSKIMEYLSQ